MGIKNFCRIFTVAIILLLRNNLCYAAQQCERLKASLTYTQEEAPRDLSGVLPVVVERINQVLEGVVDVEVEWTGGDLHGRVGEHVVQCKVTRLASVVHAPEGITVDEDGREVATQCFHVPFTILDTNECLLPDGHPMRHRCHKSALCINTDGSYECLCPRIETEETIPTTVSESFWVTIASQERGPWELSLSQASLSTCPSTASTHGCCPELLTKGEAAACRAGFHCPTDPCMSGNTCSRSATCVRSPSPIDKPNYSCQCPDGLMGNGHKCRAGDPKPQPKVMFDGKTPTELTIKNNYYCDCTKPTIDACSGFPPCKGKHQICVVGAGNQPMCACKPGYVQHEVYGCVDESPPVLRLKNDPNDDQILRLKQGDVYKEYAVDIQDENAEEYLRSLKIAYSQPIPHGCLTKIGEFHVNYTVATPWTSPPYVRITRRVIIEDIDECKLDSTQFERTCPALVPKCATEQGATCVNTIGSYTCKCPKYTAGDGFELGLSFDPANTPDGFKGGQGCHDTGKPVIKLLGPNPKVFQICECGGITGIMGKKGDKDLRLKDTQQSHYSDDIKNLIRSTAGAELCATHLNPMPNPNDCVSAYDETYKGRVDLSKSVKIGDPVKKAGLKWSVPYDVMDEAGNAAITVWRDVQIEEVDLVDVEAKIRKEFMQHQKEEVKRAVENALVEERKKNQEILASGRNRRKVSADDCPECPKCDCPAEFDMSMCASYCKAQAESCAIDEESFVIRAMLYLERYVPPSTASAILAATAIFGFLMIARLICTLLFNPRAFRGYYNDQIERERERAVMNSVTYYDDDGRRSDGFGTATATSAQRHSTTATGNGYFTPSDHNQQSSGSRSGLGRQDRSGIMQSGGSANIPDIYLSPTSIITPNKRREGMPIHGTFGSAPR